MIEKVFPKLRDLESLRQKIHAGHEVHIGVFCSGNGDRSPLIEQVLKAEFQKAGLNNVNVFSFGVSTSPTSHLSPASKRTADYPRQLGYNGIDSHQRRHVGDADVQQQIKKADLLLAVSPAHMAMVAEYGADEEPQAAHEVLKKTWQNWRNNL